MDIKEVYSSWENLLVVIASVVLIIAAFLTWANVSYSAELATYAPSTTATTATGTGMMFGYISAACGLVALLLFWFRKFNKIWAIILGGIAFLIGGLIYIYNTKVIPTKTIDVIAHNGPGVYLTMIAAIGLIISGFLIKKK